MMTVIDVWGGKSDTEHLARFIRQWGVDAISLVRNELSNGFLVNVRREVAWGPDAEFDNRPPGARGLN